MAELMQPFERLWAWVDKTGGYPGKIMFVCIIIMMIVGGLTWYSNRK
jgi:hypothetical protein